MQIDSWNNYFINGTSVLKNNLNLTDKNELEKQEKLITLKKLAYLELFPIKGKFDEKHLLKIHYFLFCDIYPFAGKYRTCTMAKTTRSFYDPSDIKQYLNIELKRMQSELKNIFSIEYYSFFLADLYYQLMTIHPFREGNGRTVREFLREYVLENNNKLPFNVMLDFSLIDQEEFLKAVEYHYVYPSLLQMLFLKALVPSKENIKHKIK